MTLILASTSAARARLLRDAGVPFEAVPARVDEASIRAALGAEGAGPRDMADALAEAKARKIGASRPDRLVLGCDQILDLDGAVISKPESPEAALAQLCRLGGATHRLHSAVVAYEGGEPVWRHVGVARLTMRAAGEAWLGDYVARHWDDIRHSAGSYQVEGEAMRLFQRIDGDLFTVLGLPMLPLLSWLVARGTLPA